MKIAVTTASGQLGTAIVKKAIEHFGKENIIGLARTPEKAKHLEVEVRKGDYTVQKDFEESLKDVDVLIMVSGNDMPENRIEQHRNIIRGAKMANVRKVIYISIMGIEGRCKFDSIIKSNRQTEKDIAESGMDYAIARNGLYVEADIEALPDYIKEGKITNSAADGKCAYTSRAELAEAYMHLVKNEELKNNIYNVAGEKITQQELTDAINSVYNLNLKYETLSVEDYENDRVNAHGEYFGKVIAGIYEGIRNGTFDIKSDFEKITGRKHQTNLEYLKENKIKV